MKLQRYTWENAVIESEALGHIKPGAVNFCLRIARSINWNRRGEIGIGLNWDNPTAFASVGTSNATFYRYKDELEGAGLITMNNGNVIPRFPDDREEQASAYKAMVKALKDSQSEKKKRQKDSQSENENVPEDSQSESEDSQSENENSQPDSTYSEDTLSEDTFSDYGEGYAHASPVGTDSSLRSKETSSSHDNDRGASLRSTDREAASISEEEGRDSQIENEDEYYDRLAGERGKEFYFSYCSHRGITGWTPKRAFAAVERRLA